QIGADDEDANRASTVVDRGKAEGAHADRLELAGDPPCRLARGRCLDPSSSLGAASYIADQPGRSPWGRVGEGSAPARCDDLGRPGRAERDYLRKCDGIEAEQDLADASRAAGDLLCRIEPGKLRHDLAPPSRLARGIGIDCPPS